METEKEKSKAPPGETHPKKSILRRRHARQETGRKEAVIRTWMVQGNQGSSCSLEYGGGMTEKDPENCGYKMKN